MPPSIPEHIRNLQRYLLQPSERNEDLAISFFRHLYGEKFKHQSDVFRPTESGSDWPQKSQLIGVR